MFKKKTSGTAQSPEMDRVRIARFIARSESFARYIGQDFLVGVSGEEEGGTRVTFHFANGDVVQGVDAASDYLLAAQRSVG